ncbi:MAG: PAS domain-containing protein [Caldimonas sp.]
MNDPKYLIRAADKIPSMLAYWGADQLCRYANRAYSVWFGVEPDQMPGRSIRDLLGDTLYALNEPYIMAALAGEAQTFERIVPGPDGVNRHSLAHYIPDIVDGQVIGFVAHVTEVTRLKDRQAALQSVIDSLEGEVEKHRHAEEDLSADQHRLVEATARIASEKKQFEDALRDVTKLVDTLKEAVVEQVAILDGQGVVTATNSSWREFAQACGTDGCGTLPRSEVGANYIVECRGVGGPAGSDAVRAAQGISTVLSGWQYLFTLEYKCDVLGEERWYYMSATSLRSSGSGAVIVHADITPNRRRRGESLRAAP